MTHKCILEWDPIPCKLTGSVQSSCSIVLNASDRYRHDVCYSTIFGILDQYNMQSVLRIMAVTVVHCCLKVVCLPVAANKGVQGHVEAGAYQVLCQLTICNDVLCPRVRWIICSYEHCCPRWDNELRSFVCLYHSCKAIAEADLLLLTLLMTKVGFFTYTIIRADLPRADAT